MNNQLEVARSSVQTWECDQMGHMNVQFYLAKADEGLLAMASALGLSPRAQKTDRAALLPKEQHIRFHRELRPGAPFVMTAGILSVQKEGAIIYQELKHTATNTVSATIVTRAEWCEVEWRGGLPLPAIAIAKASQYGVELPTHAAARGIELTPPRPAPTLSDANAMGLITTLRGAVLEEHCDGWGYMTNRHYIGRVSDAIPNLLVHTRGEDRSSSGIGGAALEYRFVYRSPARAHDLLEVKSGLKSVTNKAYNWCHWLFDPETGECFATSEAVAVAMDLNERKAIAIPPQMRERLEALIVPDLSV